MLSLPVACEHELCRLAAFDAHVQEGRKTWRRTDKSGPGVSAVSDADCHAAGAHIRPPQAADFADSLEGKITLDLESITDRFTVLTEDYVSQAPQTWSALVQLLDRQERMKVVYEKFNGEVGNYVLDPYHVISYHGNWYVLANEIDKGRIATFAVSRIRSVTGTGKFF